MKFPDKIKWICILLILVIFLVVTGCSNSQKQDNHELLNGDFWKEQALQDILPYWIQHVIDHKNGAFITHLDRNWNQINVTEKYPSMISRQIFSYSVAYLLSGEDKYIQIASKTVDFLLEHVKVEIVVHMH